MLTTDLALRFDPAYEKISRRFLEHPGAVRGRVRARLVQAHASRHGPARALSRPRSAEAKSCIWQDPIPAVESRADRRARHRRAQGKILASGLDGVASSSRRRGRRPRRSAAPTSAAARTARASGSRRRRTGRSIEPAQLAKVLEDARGHPGRVQQVRSGRQAGVARGSDRARRLRRRRAGGEERRPRT